LEKEKGIMTPQEIILESVLELRNLRTFATQDEINRLGNLVIADDPRQCIYGQMTGSCFSFRAKELGQKSSSSFIEMNDDNNVVFSDEDDYIAMFGEEIFTYDILFEGCLTALEYVIMFCNIESITHIVEYLRGTHNEDMQDFLSKNISTNIVI
jgi:hypothetical protein